MHLTMMKEGAVRTRWTELLDLEEMLGQLLMSAIKLPLERKGATA